MVNIIEFDDSSADQGLEKGSSDQIIDEVVHPEGGENDVEPGEFLVIIMCGGVVWGVIHVYRRGTENKFNDDVVPLLITRTEPVALLLPPPPTRLTVLSYGVSYDDLSIIPLRQYSTNIVPARMGSWNELAQAIFQYWNDNVYADAIDNPAFGANFEMFLFGTFHEDGSPITEVAPFQCWPCSILLFGAVLSPGAALPFLLLNWEFFPYLEVRRNINYLLAIELYTEI